MRSDFRKLPLLFKTFVVISAVTLGGGMAMLTPIRRAFVEKHRLMDEEEMLDIVAVMQSLPGMISANMAVLIGYRICGVVGACVSAIGVVLPPFVAILLVVGLRSMIADSQVLTQIFVGVRAGVTALMLVSVVELGQRVLRGWWTWVLCIASFLAVYLFQVSVISVLLIVLCLAVGMSFWNLRREEEHA